MISDAFYGMNNGFAMFAMAMGSLSILFGIALLILPIKYFQMFEQYGYSARLVGIIQILGGVLSVGAVQMRPTFVAYIFVFVGIALIVLSWRIAYELKPQQAKRKSKPKH